MTFLFDNTFPPQIPQILRILRVDAWHLQDHLPGDTDDVDWIPHAGRNGWVVVTADRKIRTRPPERAALRAAGVPAVFVFDGYPRQPLWSQVNWVTKHWPSIEKAVARLQPGTCCEVNVNGKVTEFCLPDR